MNATCLVCGHGPHTRQPCVGCGCKEFINAELASARTSLSLNNLLAQKIPIFESMIFDLLELLTEAFPAAVLAVDAKREERRRAYEAEQAAQQPTGDSTPPQQSGLTADQTREDTGAGGSNGEEDSRG